MSGGRMPAVRDHASEPKKTVPTYAGWRHPTILFSLFNEQYAAWQPARFFVKLKMGGVIMTTITFDTLKFVERLKAAGVPEEQAKAEVEALAEALSETIAIRELATKSDLESMKSDLIKWMAGLLLAQAAVVATLVKLL